MTLSSPSKKAATSEEAKKLAADVYRRFIYEDPTALLDATDLIRVIRLAALIDRCLEDARRQVARSASRILITNQDMFVSKGAYNYVNSAIRALAAGEGK